MPKVNRPEGKESSELQQTVIYAQGRNKRITINGNVGRTQEDLSSWPMRTF